jgi:hypothetical protein
VPADGPSKMCLRQQPAASKIVLFCFRFVFYYFILFIFDNFPKMSDGVIIKGDGYGGSCAFGNTCLFQFDSRLSYHSFKPHIEISTGAESSF